MQRIASLSEYHAVEALTDNGITDLAQLPVITASVWFGHHLWPVDSQSQRERNAVLVLVDEVFIRIKKLIRIFIVVTKICLNKREGEHSACIDSVWLCAAMVVFIQPDKHSPDHGTKRRRRLG